MSKTALITGTTSGIGEAFCNILAEEKYNLILVARNEITLERQAASLREKGVQVFTIVCDLSINDAAHFIYDKVTAKNLRVDILINNAGFNEAGNFISTNLNKEQEMIRIHIQVLTELTKLFLPEMVKRKIGKILNVGSTGSYMPCPYDAVYAATKAYVLSFSNGLYQELKGTGVTITCLCPGATKTMFAEKAKIDNTVLFKLFVMKPYDVAKIGYKSMMSGRRTVTAGVYNKVLVLSAKILPVSIINPIVQIMIK